jgi:hypothetical protein
MILYIYIEREQNKVGAFDSLCCCPVRRPQWAQVFSAVLWSNSIRWSKFHPLYEVIGGEVKIFSSLKHNMLQQFPYFPSQLMGPTMPHHLLLPSLESCICSGVEARGGIEWVPLIGGGGEVPFIKGMEREF